VKALTAVGGRLFFTILDYPQRELWLSDGSVEGTRVFADVSRSGAGDLRYVSTKDGDLLFFQGSDRAHGEELWALPLEEPAPAFRRGDCNDDGRVNISDAAWILNWLFRGGAEPGCAAAANADADGEVSISDPLALLSYLFLAGPEIPAPFLECGPGILPADEELGCATPPASCGTGQ
jgi:ELWxxDGT repeat protein